MSLAYQIELEILSMVDDTFLKTYEIRSKLVSFDSIRLSLQGSHSNIYLSLKEERIDVLIIDQIVDRHM